MSEQPALLPEERKKMAINVLVALMFDEKLSSALKEAVRGKEQVEKREVANAFLWTHFRDPKTGNFPTTEDIALVADDFCDRTMVGYDYWPSDTTWREAWERESNAITTATGSYIDT